MKNEEDELHRGGTAGPGTRPLTVRPVSNQQAPGGFRSSEGLPAAAQPAAAPSRCLCLQSDHRGFLLLLLVSKFSQEMRGLRKETNTTQHNAPPKTMNNPLGFSLFFCSHGNGLCLGAWFGVGLVVTLQNVPQQLGKY